MKATKIIAMMLVAVMLLSIGVSAQEAGIIEKENEPVLGKAAATPKIKRMTPEKVRIANKALVKFRELKQKRVEVKEAYQLGKSEWLEAKKAYAGEKSEERLQIALTKGKELLAKRAERMENQLNMLKERIGASEKLEEAIKGTLTSKIDEDLTSLEQTKMAFAAVETKEQLKEASQGLKEEWKNAVPIAKKSIHLIKSVKIKHVIDKADKVKDKITAKITNFQEKGIDTTALEAALEEFNTHMAFAKQKYEEVIEKFTTANTNEELKEIHAEIKNLLKEANQSIREAYKSLKTAVREMRQAQIQEKQELQETQETE